MDESKRLFGGAGGEVSPDANQAHLEGADSGTAWALPALEAASDHLGGRSAYLLDVKPADLKLCLMLLLQLPREWPHNHLSQVSHQRQYGAGVKVQIALPSVSSK